MMGLSRRRAIAVVATLAGLAAVFGLIVLPNSGTAEEGSKSAPR